MGTRALAELKGEEGESRGRRAAAAKRRCLLYGYGDWEGDLRVNTRKVTP